MIQLPKLQEAHVGLGIMGKEGRAAVRAADFAFSKFHYLQKVNSDYLTSLLLMRIFYVEKHRLVSFCALSAKKVTEAFLFEYFALHVRIMRVRYLHICFLANTLFKMCQKQYAQ
jgi:hypothetical protein